MPVAMAAITVVLGRSDAIVLECSLVPDRCDVLHPPPILVLLLYNSYPVYAVD